MVFSEYVKQRILYYRWSGKNYTEIVRCLSEEGHKATKVGGTSSSGDTKKRGLSPSIQGAAKPRR